jgi:adenylyl- and sulfurtransferase ThiI
MNEYQLTSINLVTDSVILAILAPIVVVDMELDDMMMVARRLATNERIERPAHLCCAYWQMLMLQPNTQDKRQAQSSNEEALNLLVAVIDERDIDINH